MIMYNISAKRDINNGRARDLKPVPVVGMETENPFQCRINCEKLVRGWLKSHPFIFRRTNGRKEKL